MRIGDRIRNGYYDSLSSASVMLAVDAYSNAVAQSATANGVKVTAIDRRGQSRNLAVGSLSPLATLPLPLDTAAVRVTNSGDFPLYYSLSEAGYERDVPATALSQGLEIYRDFLDAAGHPVTEAKLGEELTVRLRVRAIDRNVDNVAVADVLPGGLEPVLTAPGDETGEDGNGPDGSVPLWQRRLGGKGSWSLQYADIREDRVLFYGSADTRLREITYKVRATNSGSFVVPGAWGEAMYERKIFARSAGGRFTVKPPTP
jgi:uncharacterized protein YfaS (alpha-2-macroglobulin family)